MAQSSMPYGERGGTPVCEAQGLAKDSRGIFSVNCKGLNICSIVVVVQRLCAASYTNNNNNNTSSSAALMT